MNPDGIKHAKVTHNQSHVTDLFDYHGVVTWCCSTQEEGILDRQLTRGFCIMIMQLPYLPDLAPSEFWLFPRLKRHSVDTVSFRLRKYELNRQSIESHSRIGKNVGICELILKNKVTFFILQTNSLSFFRHSM